MDKQFFTIGQTKKKGAVIAEEMKKMPHVEALRWHGGRFFFFLYNFIADIVAVFLKIGSKNLKVIKSGKNILNPILNRKNILNRI